MATRNRASSIVAASLAGASFVLVISAPAFASPQEELTVQTRAGTFTGSLSEYDTGTSYGGRLREPRGFTFDQSGLLILADAGNGVLRRFDPTGHSSVPVWVGMPQSHGTADGWGAQARFRQPWDVVRDGEGNFYVTDAVAHTIRRVTPDGYVSTIAGSPDQRGSSDGTGASARFNSPRGLAIDSLGNLFVADTLNHAIRKVTRDGAVSTLAGLAGSAGFADGVGAAARFDRPSAVAVEPSGSLLVADALNEVIRRVTQDGIVTVFAGTPLSGGSEDGGPGSGRFSYPQELVFDASGLLKVIDGSGYRLRSVTPAGVISTAFSAAFGSDPGPNGYNRLLRVSTLSDLGLDPRSGAMLVTDSGNHTLHSIYRDPYSGLYSLPVRAGASASPFSSVQGVAASASGEILVVDRDRHEVQKISTSGYSSRLIGTYQPCVAPLGGAHSGVCGPEDVAFGPGGTVYVLDRVSVRKFSALGSLMAILAGPGALTESGRAVRLRRPYGLTIDLAGNVYVADAAYDFSGIVKITPGGEASVLAGGLYGYADGPRQSARFAFPAGVAVDEFGVLFVADTSNCVIRRIGLDGQVTTIAGRQGHCGYADGSRSTAEFDSPTKVLVDTDGTLIVGDFRRLRRVTMAGDVTSIAGSLDQDGFSLDGYQDGTGRAAHFAGIRGLGWMAAGTYVVGDSGNQSVRIARKTIPDSIVASATNMNAGGTIALSASAGSGTAFQWEELFDSGSPYVGYFSGSTSGADATYRCEAQGVARVRLRASGAAGVRWSTVDLTCEKPATLSVGDVRMVEGNRGLAKAAFALTLSAPRPEPVVVTFDTLAGTADGSDFQPISGLQVTIQPGTLTRAVEVDVFGDETPEANEYFDLVVRSTTGLVTIQDGVGRASVFNDDDGGEVAIFAGDTRSPEGYSGNTTLVFPVALSAPSATPVSVTYSVPSWSSLNPSATLTFAPGEMRKTVTVLAGGADNYSEANGIVQFRLSNAIGAVIGDDIGDGIILNDDDSLFGVTDASVVEGTGGPVRYLTFTITRTVPTYAGYVGYRTRAGTASSGIDYAPTSGILSFPAGYQSLAIQVPVFPDAAIEADETVFLELFQVGSYYDSRGTVFDNVGVGTIQGDDGLLLSVGDKTGAEGNVGLTGVPFTVRLSAPAAVPVTVEWSTSDGTATAPLDYQSASGTVTFNPGETSREITVQVVGDTGEESFETFFVHLSDPTGGAAIGDGEGKGTITNTDGSTDRSRLMFHNFVTNRLYRWHMKNGNTLDTYNWVTPWATDPGWTIGAVADFDQDGQLDYLWHNVDDGRLLFWYIDGDNLKGFQFLPYLLGPPWSVATVFDANGDGAQDIAYYNATSGAIKVVLHDNGTRLGEYHLSQVLPPSGSLRVVNTADANNDGDDELILYNSATGQVVAWNVNGAAVDGTMIYPNQQSTIVAFNLVSTKTDFNDDGRPDFLWHNPSPNGTFSVWFMNGTVREGVGQFQPFTATDPVWRVVGSASIW